jgi:hypothetical protein
MNLAPRVDGLRQLKRTLDRRAGNARAARLRPPLQKGQQPGNATLQRAVILLDVNKDDYALHKVLTGLEPGSLELLQNKDDVDWFVEERKADPTRRALLPYRNLAEVARAIQRRNKLLIASPQRAETESPAIAANEDVHVVGHGREDLVWTLPQHGGEITDFAELGKWLQWATPGDWTGTTRLLTCNSAREGTGNPTVADLLKTSLGGKPVTGQRGFAYGMGRGQPVAVLKQEFEDLYKGDVFNEDVGKYLTETAYRVAAADQAIGYKPDVNQLRNKGEWRKVWDAFVGRMNAIQSALAEAVRKTPGENTLAKARALESDQAFQSKIAEQRALFTAFKLWRT